MRISIPKAIALYAAWLSFISGVLLVALGNVLPFRIGFVRPEDVFTCLIEAELFFVLVVWPFFIPRLAAAKVEVPAGVGGEPQLLILQVGVLFVVAAPIALLCQNLANVGVREFFAGHLLVATAACFVAAILGMGAERHARTAPWYFLGFFVFSALLPFAHYLVVEYAHGSLGFLSVVSPFWAASRLDGAVPLVSSGAFGLGALALFAAAPFLRRPVAGPTPAQ